MFENLYIKSNETARKFRDRLNEREAEISRLLLELKNSKIHIALLEEQSSQREFMLK